MRALALLTLLASMSACFADDPTNVTPLPETCDTYCGLALTYCQNGNLLFADPSTCPNVCAALDANGTAGAIAGNTLQCRLTYLFAAHKRPHVFCREAAPDSFSCK